MKYLLDTSALLAHYRNEPGAQYVQSLFEHSEHKIYLSTLSIAELARRLVSLGLLPEEARETTWEYVNLATQIFPIDTAVSLRAFELSLSVSTRLPLIDALIAATTAVYGRLSFIKILISKQSPEIWFPWRN